MIKVRKKGVALLYGLLFFFPITISKIFPMLEHIGISTLILAFSCITILIHFSAFKQHKYGLLQRFNPKVTLEMKASNKEALLFFGSISFLLGGIVVLAISGS